MLDQRLGNVEQDYASIYSFKMTVQDMIQRSSANRPKRKPPFYFDGGAYASYNLTEVALNLNMIRVKKHQAREEETRVTEQRSFLIDRTESPNPPEVVEFNGRRFVRDYSGATRLKQIYGYSCQVCGCTVATFECVRADACGYAEVHHIKPLGSGHQGPDYPGNMLVLCPNHHAAFDLSTMALDPETLEVYDLEADRELHNKGPIFLHESGHDFDSECLRYA